jgi:hypothetical protein
MKKNRPVDKLYKTIANAQKKLEVIRKGCKHKKTHVGLYSWRIGSVVDAELCDACDAVVDNFNMIFGAATSNNTITIENKPFGTLRVNQSGADKK